jgi:hypothetical protein
MASVRNINRLRQEIASTIKAELRTLRGVTVSDQIFKQKDITGISCYTSNRLYYIMYAINRNGYMLYNVDVTEIRPSRNTNNNSTINRIKRIMNQRGGRSATLTNVTYYNNGSNSN